MEKNNIPTRIIENSYPTELYCWLPENPGGYTIIMSGGFYQSKEQAKSNVPGYGKHILVSIKNPYNEAEWYRSNP